MLAGHEGERCNIEHDAVEQAVERISVDGLVGKIQSNGRDTAFKVGMNGGIVGIGATDHNALCNMPGKEFIVYGVCPAREGRKAG